MEKIMEKTNSESLNSFLGLETFHIRLTLKSELENIIDFIETSITKKYIICDELTHYHCLAETQMSKKEIVRVIKEKLNLKGNADFSVIKAKSKQQLKKYILKDGNYKYKGFTDEEIKLLRKQSFKKGIDKLQIVLEGYEIEYYNGDISFTQFGERYIQLKIEYNQNIHGNHVKAYLTKIKMKKNPDCIREYISDLMR